MGYIKALASRMRRLADEAGQNIVETALIIGVISVVIVGTFMASDIDAAIQDVAGNAACVMGDGTYAAATNTCTPNP